LVLAFDTMLTIKLPNNCPQVFQLPKKSATVLQQCPLMGFGKVEFIQSDTVTDVNTKGDHTLFQRSIRPLQNLDVISEFIFWRGVQPWVGLLRRYSLGTNAVERRAFTRRTKCRTHWNLLQGHR
jgi:hypothetical protein